MGDLWKYDPVSNYWTYLRGFNNAVNLNGIYSYDSQIGQLVKPGCRHSGATWSDNLGNLYLFGGSGPASSQDIIAGGFLNDLWKFTPSTNQWYFINGDSIANVKGIYGSKNIYSSTNKPGARVGASTWVDASGIFFLFGGYGYSSVTGVESFLNDLWKYDPTINQWAWVSGGDTYNQYGSYGVLATENPNNFPGSRSSASACLTQDKSSLWLFGGSGYASTGSLGKLGDLWKLKLTPTAIGIPGELCPGGSTTLLSNLSGINFQWQVNSGAGYINIVNNSYYIGSNSQTLQLNNVPSSWYIYKYRCIIDGKNSNVFTLRFLNYWKGSVNTLWNNPLNWSCGSLPDINTDVIVNSGSLLLDLNTSCRSLRINSGATFNASTGYTLSIRN